MQKYLLQHTILVNQIRYISDFSSALHRRTAADEGKARTKTSMDTADKSRSIIFC